MKKVDLLSLDIEEYLESIDVEKIKKELQKLKPPSKFKKIIDDLEIIIKADIVEIETTYKKYSYGLSKLEKTKVKDIFNYSGYRQNASFIEQFKKLNIKSCPFCNNNHVYFYKKKGGKYNTLATLEHYYPKAEYPHLSLSFYNLIPCCSICNSKFKGNKTHVGEILHPYRDDFNENARFSISVNDAIIKKSKDINISLKTTDEKCEKSIDRFQLDKVYEEHRDIAKEIWNKAQVYNESRIEELYKEFYKSLGYSKEDVKNMIFCNYLKNDDINKRNHSKLTQDILKQFDIR